MKMWFLSTNFFQKTTILELNPKHITDLNHTAAKSYRKYLLKQLQKYYPHCLIKKSPHNKSGNVHFFWWSVRNIQHAINVFFSPNLGTIYTDERQVTHDSSNLKECNKYKIRACSLPRVNIKYTNNNLGTKQNVISDVETSGCRQKTQKATKWLYIPNSQWKKHQNMISFQSKTLQKKNIFTCENM
jgi:hypothetical protein